jgi:two-component system, cell cycle response regulator
VKFDHHPGPNQVRTRLLGERSSRIALVVMLLVSTQLGTPSKGRAQNSLSEYQVKAAYLFNLLKFVEWPESAFAGPSAPIVIGIVGNNPFGNALPLIVSGKTVQGRDLVIRKYHVGEDMRGSHILGSRTLASTPCGSMPGGFEMKILIADDEPVSRRMLQGLLSKWGYDVVSAEDGKSAWEQLSSQDAPRIALLDWMMPGRNGVDVCREMRANRPEPYTYILLLTAKDAKESVVEGLESGADDYLTKPFHPQELKARLRVGLRLLNLEDTLVQAREAMRFKATHDALTGVWNRGTILETLGREITRSQREGASLGVVIGDLDHFKSVNDTYGHLAGDDVLREATKRMQASVRSYDALGRYGGEEFLVLLPGCDAAETADKAEQLRAAINQQLMETPSGPLRITMSLGGVATGNWPNDNANQVSQMADAALYRAKEEGRNRVVMAGAAEHEEAHPPTFELSPPGPEKK